MPARTGEGITVLATGVTDGSELPYVCWELNLSRLKDQQMLVTTEKISFSPPLYTFTYKNNIGIILQLVIRYYVEA